MRSCLSSRGGGGVRVHVWSAPVLRPALHAFVCVCVCVCVRARAIHADRWVCVRVVVSIARQETVNMLVYGIAPVWRVFRPCCMPIYNLVLAPILRVLVAGWRVIASCTQSVARHLGRFLPGNNGAVHTNWVSFCPCDAFKWCA